jgi:hypothetical protein
MIKLDQEKPYNISYNTILGMFFHQLSQNHSRPEKQNVSPERRESTYIISRILLKHE